MGLKCTTSHFSIKLEKFSVAVISVSKVLKMFSSSNFGVKCTEKFISVTVYTEKVIWETGGVAPVLIEQRIFFVHQFNSKHEQ